ncbi:DUF3667 domain-containing protein [Pedobacter sp. Leaf170]|uniref:DUF3667 domain-containing protein n=1 Tax=Pedobacter sp. Leaf170 TaxID=2876558 RepID=UPI001E4216CA|nr:DUF3667 domain-containing protein [Pedobacter sp. Leaf170]
MSAGKYRKEHNCLNCGSHVESHYCSSCGQPNLELKESFWGFISHSIAHYFHFDNKFFQTLTPLLTKPGQVTLDYLAGKRARYINPVSMYIFVSIVYFLIAYSPEHKTNTNEHENKAPTKSETKKVLDSADKELTKIGLKNTSPALFNHAKKQILEEIDKEAFKKLSLNEQNIKLAELRKQNKANKTDSLTNIIKQYNAINIKRNDSTYAAYLSRQKSLSSEEQDNWIEKLSKKRAITLGQNAEVIQETLEHNRPKQYFLLMPLLALFIMWNFRKNHIYYLDHLIFTIHGMTAYFIVSILTKPFIKYVFGEDSLMANIIGLGIFAWICWYMFNALKIFYQRKKVIGKMITIFILYAIAFKITEMVMLNLIYYVAT